MGVWQDTSVDTVFRIPEKEFEPPKADAADSTKARSAKAPNH